MQEQIDADLKQAMLAGDKTSAETLRGLKSALHNEAINRGTQNTGLNDEQVQKILATEAKKRAEAAEVYQKAGENERANKELAEKAIIEKYLPEAMSEPELKALIDKHIAILKASSPAEAGRVIGAVKAEVGVAADGALIARLVGQVLSEK